MPSPSRSISTRSLALLLCVILSILQQHNAFTFTLSSPPTLLSRSAKPKTTTTKLFFISPNKAIQTTLSPAFHPQTSRYETTLSASLITRAWQILKSNLTYLTNKFESPEKLLAQSLIDMNSDLQRIRQSAAEIKSHNIRLTQQKNEVKQGALDWYARAKLAMKRGDDNLAKEALSRKSTQLTFLHSLEKQEEGSRNTLTNLETSIKLLSAKIGEAKLKNISLLARTKAAKSTKKANDMLSGVTGKTSMDLYTRMEEKVEGLEIEAEVSGELGKGVVDELEGKFKEIEGGSVIDDEFAKMKTEVLGDGKGKLFPQGVEDATVISDGEWSK